MRQLGYLGGAHLGVALLLGASAGATTRQFAARPREPDPAEDLATTRAREPITLYQHTPLAPEAFTPYLTRRRQPSPDPAVAERRAQIKRLLNPKRA